MPCHGNFQGAYEGIEIQGMQSAFKLYTPQYQQKIQKSSFIQEVPPKQLIFCTAHYFGMFCELVYIQLNIHPLSTQMFTKFT